MERRIYGVKTGVTLEGEKIGGMLPGELRLLVENMAIREQKLPVEPTLDKESGRMIPGREGWVVDIEGSINKALWAEEGDNLELRMQAVPSRYSVQDLQRISASRGYYETFFSGTLQRHTNILLATNSVNNSLLWPEEEFSFNDTVGPRTPERGYLPAPVFLRGESEIDYGGGVCQVATTLFNAAEKAGLEIIERHRHSQEVHYVAEDRDATVSYDALDLKFSNNTGKPLIIKAGISQGKLWVNVLGEED